MARASGIVFDDCVCNIDIISLITALCINFVFYPGVTVLELFHFLFAPGLQGVRES